MLPLFDQTVFVYDFYPVIIRLDRIIQKALKNLEKPGFLASGGRRMTDYKSPAPRQMPKIIMPQCLPPAQQISHLTPMAFSRAAWATLSA
jgi:hypothetical protein